MRDTGSIFFNLIRPALVTSALCVATSVTGAQAPRQFPRPAQIISADDVFKLGASLDVGWFAKFSNRVADQPNLATSKADDVAPGFSASLELSPMGMRPFFTRVSANYGIQDFEQTYNASSPLDPTNATGRVTGIFVDGQLGLRLLRSRKSIFSLATGPTWTRNAADIDFIYSSQPVEVNRVENGWKWNAAASLWRSLDDRLGLQLAVTYTDSFKEGDADQNWRLSTGITLGLGGGQ